MHTFTSNGAQFVISRLYVIILLPHISILLCWSGFKPQEVWSGLFLVSAWYRICDTLFRCQTSHKNVNRCSYVSLTHVLCVLLTGENASWVFILDNENDPLNKVLYIYIEREREREGGGAAVYICFNICVWFLLSEFWTSFSLAEVSFKLIEILVSQFPCSIVFLHFMYQMPWNEKGNFSCYKVLKFSLIFRSFLSWFLLLLFVCLFLFSLHISFVH